MKHITIDELKRMGASEGLILQGCGGDPQEWIDGINGLLTKQGILKDGSRFENVSAFEHGGLQNLLFHFDDSVRLDMGKLAMWRLQSHSQFGGTWLSDYLPNKLGIEPGEQPQAQAYSRAAGEAGDTVTWYFPLDVRMLTDDIRDDGGSFEDYDRIDSREAVWYKDAILGQIEKENHHFDTPRMLAEYIHDDALKSKVGSMTPTVEEHGGRLWGAMVMRLTSGLTPEETAELKEYIAGQSSDGYGEGLEQREIPVPDGELYVAFWQSGSGYAIYTQEEFAALPVHQQTKSSARRKPRCPLLGADSNVFNLMSIASRTLTENGMADAAKEMRSRVTESGGYDSALAIIMEYVTPVTVKDHSQDGPSMRM